MTNWKELEKKYFMRTLVRAPLTIVKGQGSYVWDESGRKYLDFVAGWAVNSLGHCHPAVVEAVKRQVGELIQTSNHYYTLPQLQLAQLLVENSSLNKVFLCNSGAEAAEGAVKLARRYGKLHLNGAYEVITATGSFHGRTLAMVSASGQLKHQQPYTPLPAGFINVAYNSIGAIMEATTSTVCAVMLEPVQGEGGVNVPSPNYLKEVRRWCDEKGIVLILDEIQTGIGRTGSLFAHQIYGIEPDVMTLAKGLGGGLPIGAIMAKDKFSVFTAGEHGSTFGGNPVTCAAAYAALAFIIENDIPRNAYDMGNRLTDGLKRIKERWPALITEIRGKGLLLAVEFSDVIAKELTQKCLENGLLVNDVKPNALRLMPALNITGDEVEEALSLLEMALCRLRSCQG
ncbi:aspartate aminotransferase family protein [Dehalogenimonas alkenigignens]|uniref:Acetylornithine aminotransferase n=1 Tax=Dehalogenimonas alkenigignens TaxID=1217799 RepID=A0A0W0GK30_9CHLR|nr:aspartate aminotransferase family protein [Dehalogenimonas alkenigignens]KTB48923.1 transaminase, acetylornithine/succinylornithine family [Dehalogenimonas alkenigignens]PVV82751.1 aspartate aminotransferase family protein [Dehalogenimonas alkenigignens]